MLANLSASFLPIRPARLNFNRTFVAVGVGAVQAGKKEETSLDLASASNFRTFFKFCETTYGLVHGQQFMEIWHSCIHIEAHFTGFLLVYRKSISIKKIIK